MNLDALTNHSSPEIRAAYTKRDTMLYALGVAACQDPLDADGLKFVTEGAVQALPSLSAPLPAEGEVTGRYRITGVVDKGAHSGALVYFEKSLVDADGAALGSVESTYFLRGDSGCGSWGAPGREFPTIPNGASAGYLDVTTLPIAALIYRLSGDYNPLHSDPALARKAGFERPILHGLCTYGIACQSLIRMVCGGDPTRLLGMGARFTKPVYPGDTLHTEYWRSGDAVQFRCSSVQRNEVVLDHGIAKLNR